MSTMSEKDLDQTADNLVNLNMNHDNDPEDAFLYEVIGSLDLDDPITTDEVVEGQKTANKYLYVIKKLRDEIENVVTVGNAQIKDATDFMDREVAKRDKTIAFLSRGLHLFMMGQEQKTMNLPNGSLKMRVRQEKVEITDPKIVINWVGTSTLTSEWSMKLLTKKITVSKAGVKEYMKATGEIPDGIEVTQQEPSFTAVTK
ncbi:MAG: host-nuclease inhibitor Gam family protein [Erythrobacter sp.]|nr:host-nuclease inhibitor Gam family protein [Erythrobacter sp.]